VFSGIFGNFREIFKKNHKSLKKILRIQLPVNRTKKVKTEADIIGKADTLIINKTHMVLKNRFHLTFLSPNSFGSTEKITNATFPIILSSGTKPQYLESKEL